jgi:hypothetical protein
MAQPAKLPNTHARKGTSVRQTDRSALPMRIEFPP